MLIPKLTKEVNTMKKELMILANILLLGLVAGLSLATLNVLDREKEDELRLDVSKSIEKEIEPDKGKLVFSIVSLDDDAEKAIDENSAINNNIVEQYKNKEGIEISTTRYTLREKSEWNRETEKSEFVGYEVYNTLTIETKNIGEIGEYIPDIIDMGANRIESISYELSEEKKEELYEEMLKEGVEEARKEAETLAKMMDKKIDEIIDIQPNQINYPPIYFRGDVMMESAKAESPVLSPEKQTMTLNVNVVFKLKR
jgi:hypothetical protein